MPKQQPPWEPWLYDLWGPASTGRTARNAAIAANNERYRRAEEWRASKLTKETTPTPKPTQTPEQAEKTRQDTLAKARAELGITDAEAAE